MLRALLAIVIAAAAFAQQTPQTPPPDVDTALRARINEFYQLEVAGKFNEALKLVADDTKDFFVGSSKPSYQSLLQIDNIQYSGNFTRASVIVVVNRMLAVQGFAGRPLATKISSQWKQENGQWYWFVEPNKLPRSPFGPGGMPGPAGMPAPGKMATPGQMPLPGDVASTARGTRAAGAPPVTSRPMSPTLVRIDKAYLQVKASAPSSDHLTLLNPAATAAVLTLTDPKIPGLTVKLDETTVKSVGKTTLTVDWSGAAEPPKPPVMILLTVEHTRQRIPIRVVFAK